MTRGSPQTTVSAAMPGSSREDDRKKNSARPLWQPQRGLVSVIIPRTTGSALAPRIGHLSDYAMFMPKIDRTRMMAV